MLKESIVPFYVRINPPSEVQLTDESYDIF